MSAHTPLSGWTQRRLIELFTHESLYDEKRVLDIPVGYELEYRGYKLWMYKEGDKVIGYLNMVRTDQLISTNRGFSPAAALAMATDLQNRVDEITEMWILQAVLLPVGTLVVVTVKDPNWTYGGCAQPLPGMKGTVVETPEFREPPKEGMIAVSFNETELGYEANGGDDIVLFFNPFHVEKRT